MTDNQLGEFLRARRERVSPAAVGLLAIGHRRTPGLRREEVAAGAGISIDYLIRLERGRDRHPSPAVVDALADVLGLDADGRAHLADLADPRAGQGVPLVATASEPIRVLIDSWPNPTIVTNGVLDLIGANSAGERLHRDIGLQIGDNMARALFLEPGAREIYLGFDDVAVEVVGNLRSMSASSGRHPELTALVGELSVASDHFARLWAQGEVRGKSDGVKVIAHPEHGRLDLRWSTLHVAGAPGEMIVTYSAEAGSESERVLAALGDPATSPRSARR
ncbi:MAG: helix-turn-helix transcriptional regulator [Corynebacteriales bacterium]|uniref:Helix-turn-helix transcriptional regulator n=1 Tax=Williamsia herbipolensis TaxID=1603258 RepID=A0AAU4K2Q9_9NOCA|nr:helix-turn-helix transcriptional regulator [Williamsia herbipolensis]MCX6468126.1 helix-turn-helix transcriptional regulator [Mycobacteriales bacterium]